MKSKGLIYVVVLFLLVSCSQRNSSIEDTSTSSDAKVFKTTVDSVDHFQQAVESLTSIGYYISGKDSVAVAKDPTYFIEMNGVMKCFQNPFDKNKSGLAAYKKVKQVRKFHVAQNKNQNGPQATIIQLEFNSASAAAQWFQQLELSPHFTTLKNKPKTNIWTRGNYVYFIQSYYDVDRKILNEITLHFREELNDNKTY